MASRFAQARLLVLLAYVLVAVILVFTVERGWLLALLVGVVGFTVSIAARAVLVLRDEAKGGREEAHSGAQAPLEEE